MISIGQTSKSDLHVPAIERKKKSNQKGLINDFANSKDRKNDV